MIELELFVVLLPALHHQLISVRFAVAVPVVHVLRVGAGVGKALQALATLERLFTRMKTFMLGLKEGRMS